MAVGGPPILAVAVDTESAAATVRVCGELDAATVGEFRAGLEEALARRPSRLVVDLAVDLAATTFIDAAGMHLIAWARKAAPPACEMILRSPNRLAQRLIELTGLDRTCRLEADRAVR